MRSFKNRAVESGNIARRLPILSFTGLLIWNPIQIFVHSSGKVYIAIVARANYLDFLELKFTVYYRFYDLRKLSFRPELILY